MRDEFGISQKKQRLEGADSESIRMTWRKRVLEKGDYYEITEYPGRGYKRRLLRPLSGPDPGKVHSLPVGGTKRPGGRGRQERLH